jgi:hypothetical protein
VLLAHVFYAGLAKPPDHGRDLCLQVTAEVDVIAPARHPASYVTSPDRASRFNHDGP